jgi:S1-C subfamily serine protease
MVILAGSGHIAGGSGIPRRLARRLPASSAIVLNGWEGALEPGLADFILLPEPRMLPPSGKFGLLLEAQNPLPVVEACMPDSPCTRAGLQQGDRFLSIDGEPIEDMTDLRLAMWDKLPGDTVTLEVSRKRWFSAPQRLSYRIELR